jgi:catechol-2,3-dioxygenase
MRIQALGHVVVYVNDLERAEAFYSGVLGMPIAARLSEPMKMTFFTLGNHHDFAIMESAEGSPTAGATSNGLCHVAFKIGDSLEELRAVKAQLAAAGVAVNYEMDHTVTQSLYFHDPDHNEIELYVDTSEIWKTDPQVVASAELVVF